MSGSDSVNPYRPPSMMEQPESWWSRLRRRLWDSASDSPSRFEKGHAIICSGIAFFVNPLDPTVLFAASPSADQSDQRMNFIAEETLRCLKHFVSDFPTLIPVLQGRRLTVRMIQAYSDSQSEFIREVQFDASAIGTMISPLSQGTADEPLR